MCTQVASSEYGMLKGARIRLDHELWSSITFADAATEGRERQQTEHNVGFAMVYWHITDLSLSLNTVG